MNKGYNKFRNNNLGKIEAFEQLLKNAYAQGFNDGLGSKEVPFFNGEVAAYTANEQRKLLIDKAKEFNDRHLKSGVFVSVDSADSPCGHYDCTPKIVINEEKRTVVVLMLGMASGKVRAKGISKCMLGEVFNADIGKAIALARALNIPVPKEFLEAVQPSEVVEGAKVLCDFQAFGNAKNAECKVMKFELGGYLVDQPNERRLDKMTWISDTFVKIITNDSHAAYEGVTT